MATAADLASLQDLAKLVEIKRSSGSVYHFRVFPLSELPTQVPVTMRLDKQWMLSVPEGGDAVAEAQFLLDEARSRWPSGNDTKATVVTCTWETKNNLSYWHVRFRVSLDIAEHIRDTLKGRIQFGMVLVTVFYLQKPLKGERPLTTLVNESAPADQGN